jgi:hypothetical protein
MDPKGREQNGLDWMNLPRFRNYMRAVVETVINHRVEESEGHFFNYMRNV